jgi:hypothetical protein
MLFFTSGRCMLATNGTVLKLLVAAGSHNLPLCHSSKQVMSSSFSFYWKTHLLKPWTICFHVNHWIFNLTADVCTHHYHVPVMLELYYRRFPVKCHKSENLKFLQVKGFLHDQFKQKWTGLLPAHFTYLYFPSFNLRVPNAVMCLHWKLHSRNLLNG